MWSWPIGESEEEFTRTAVSRFLVGDHQMYFGPLAGISGGVFTVEAD